MWRQTIKRRNIAMKLNKKFSIVTLIIFALTTLYLVGCANVPAVEEKGAEVNTSEVTAAVENTAVVNTTEKIKIMCYGDSNTFGWMPVEIGAPTTRYPSDVRWTGILQKELGDQYQIIEEGLNGRTAGVDDYANGLSDAISKDLNLNGRPTLLPILKSQLPVDLVVIMLGTNDVKYYLEQTPEQIAVSMEKLATLVNESVQKETEWMQYEAPKVLIIAPVPVIQGKAAGLNELFQGGDVPSKELAKLYEEVANKTGAEFFDAASLIPVADGVDGIHLTPEAHNKLGIALAEKIKSMQIQ